VAAFPEPPERRTGVAQLLVIEGHDLDGRSLEKQVEIVTSVVASSAFQHHRRFEHRDGRHQPSVRVGGKEGFRGRPKVA
jgi:hypothetical protein